MYFRFYSIDKTRNIVQHTWSFVYTTASIITCNSLRKPLNFETMRRICHTCIVTSRTMVKILMHIESKIVDWITIEYTIDLITKCYN